MKAFHAVLFALVVVLVGGSLLLRAQKALPNEELLRQEGKARIAEATSALSSNLMHAITHGGMTNAISFCSMHALPLTDEAEDDGVLLRRVSSRTRNPSNRPTGIEQRIIDRYEAGLKQGLTPGPVLEISQDQAWYFEPILLVNPLCLSCHGDPATQIKRETLSLIKALYPEDQATGFKLNELRGVWSVTFSTIPRATAEPIDFLPTQTNGK